MSAEQRRSHDDEPPETENGPESDSAADEPEGQVSEVSAMPADGPDGPVSDSQSVAGQPEGAGGRADEGPTGPNSRAGSDKN